MAKIRGYISRLNATEESSKELKDLVGDIFDEVIFNASIPEIELVMDTRKIVFTRYSATKDVREITIKNEDRAYKTFIDSNGNSVSAGRCVVYETNTGIIISIGSYGTNINYIGGISNIVYNKNTGTICLQGSGSYLHINSSLTLDAIHLNAYTAKNDTLYACPISTTCMYLPGAAVSPYPVVTEIVHDNEPTGIYALTQGMLMNATVSDGEKNIFISNVLGLED
jgi:hypothetical protein